MEQDAITATVMDYFMGWFDGDAARMARALHPGLDKRHVPVGATGAELSAASSASQMITWTGEGEGIRARPTDLKITVHIDDVHDQIATAHVDSSVYVEYVQLVKTPAGWRIVNALYMTRAD